MLGLYNAPPEAAAATRALPIASLQPVVMFATRSLCHHFWWYSRYRVLHHALPFLSVYILCLAVEPSWWTPLSTSRTQSHKLVSVDRWLALLFSDSVRLLPVDLENCLPYIARGNVKPLNEACSVNTGLQAATRCSIAFTSSAHFRLT
jgi:hypothetical protein